MYSSLTQSYKAKVILEKSGEEWKLLASRYSPTLNYHAEVSWCSTPR